VIEIVANLVVHPLKSWIALLLEPQENLLADALQVSTVVGGGVGTASPYSQCLAETLLIDISLMVTAVLVAQTEIAKSLRMLGRVQLISTVTTVLLPDVTEMPLKEVKP
jgi:hypothetical protein